MSASSQPEFDFDRSAPADGLDRWHAQRERASRRLARRLGLPLDHEVEVRLKDGVILRGKLRLKETVLILEAVDERTLELVIGRADFRPADMDACVRLD